jgi:hypothetical protein
MSKSGKKKKVLPLVIWDTAWKLVAIARAVQLRNYKMIPVLALASTGGIVPMTYLWKNRHKGAEMHHPEDLAPA